MTGDWNSNELVGTQLGSCVLERTLGVGGMGAVYLAQQIRPRRQVAVKVLRPGRSTSPEAWQFFLARFRREADIAAGLDHANIVPIFEFGQDSDVAFLVMPYLTDGSLADLLLRAGRLPLTDAITYVEQAAAALDYAHQHGLVHRDVKPSNLLLHPDGRLMLADFGIARPADRGFPDSAPRGEQTGASVTDSEKPSGMPAGTPEYMAPEQVRGAALTPATDIYALGIVTYAMLTGQTPFGGVERHLILARQLHEQPTPIRTLRPDIPPRVAETIAWALSKDPAARPQSATAYARGLRSAAARSRPLGGLFTRGARSEGLPEAPRGLLRMAGELAGISPLASPFEPISEPLSMPGGMPPSPPIPRRDNGTRPLDRSRSTGSSTPRLIAASYDAEPLGSEEPPAYVPPDGSGSVTGDAAPTMGPGFPGNTYQNYPSYYGGGYDPRTYTAPGVPAWPGLRPPPSAPPPRRRRRYTGLRVAAGVLVAMLGCVLLLGSLSRSGLFAETTTPPVGGQPSGHLAPTATALPTPSPTVPPNWVRVSPTTFTLKCKGKSNQVQLTIRNVGNALLDWHIDAPGFSGLQFSKMSGELDTGKSVSVTARDVAWWDQQGTFTVQPDTDGAGDPATISYSVQACPWGSDGG